MLHSPSAVWGCAFALSSPPLLRRRFRERTGIVSDVKNRRIVKAKML